MGSSKNSKRSSARDSPRSSNPPTHSMYNNNRLSNRESRHTATTRQSWTGDTMSSGSGSGNVNGEAYRREKSLPASPALPPTVKAVGSTAGDNAYSPTSKTTTTRTDAHTTAPHPRPPSARNPTTLTLPPNVAVAGTGPKVPRQEPGLGAGVGRRGREKEGKGEIRVERAWEVSR